MVDVPLQLPPVPSRDLKPSPIAGNVEEQDCESSLAPVWVNGQQLDSTQRAVWEAQTKNCAPLASAAAEPTAMLGSRLEGDGAMQRFWYDACGMFGFENGPMLSILDASLPLPAMPRDDVAAASRVADCNGERTLVYVNGREVHPIDLKHFARMRLSIKEREVGSPPVFWSIDSEGVVRPCDEHGNEVECVEERVQVRISSVTHIGSSGKKRSLDLEQAVGSELATLHSASSLGSLSGLANRMHIPTAGDGYHTFALEVRAGELEWHSSPRFSDFVSFHERVHDLYPGLPLMKFPSKQPTKKQTDKFVRKRAMKLERYMFTVLQHHVVRENAELLALIGLPCAILTASSTRLRKDGFDQPLLALSDTERIAVGNLLVASAAGWNCRPLDDLLAKFLRRLLLPGAVISAQLAAKGSMTPPANIRELLENEYRWAVVWEILMVSFAEGAIDSRVHVSVQLCAKALGLPLKKLLMVEGESADFLQQKLMQMADSNRASDTKSKHRNAKIALAGLVGGGILLGAGLIATPLLIPVFLGGVTVAAGALPVGLGGALLWGGGLMAAAATPTLPLVFGAAGTGLGAHKASRITKGLTEFQFVSLPKPDPNKKKRRKKGDSLPLTSKAEAGGVSGALQNEDAGVARGNHEEEEVEEDKDEEGDSDSDSDEEGEDDMLPYTIDWDTMAVVEKPGYQPPVLRSESVDGGLVAPFTNSQGEFVGDLALLEKEVAAGRVTKAEAEEVAERLHAAVPTKEETLAMMAQQREMMEKRQLAKTKAKVAQQEAAVDAATDNHGIRVTICAQGWLWDVKEVTTLWTCIRELDPSTEAYALKWETDALHDLGICLVRAVTSKAATMAAKFWLTSMSVLLAGFFSAMALPLMILLLTGAIDNSWTIVKQRAQKAGKALAQVLMNREHGARPVTLVGVSLGGRVMYYCLKYMLKMSQKRNINPYGIIENVYLLGAACNSDPIKWGAFRKLVAGRLVNGYSKADWVLGLVHRTAGMQMSVAGLQAIEVAGVENYDLTKKVAGHLAYKPRIKKLLREMQLGRSVPLDGSAEDTLWADMGVAVAMDGGESTFSPF